MLKFTYGIHPRKCMLARTVFDSQCTIWLAHDDIQHSAVILGFKVFFLAGDYKHFSKILKKINDSSTLEFKQCKAELVVPFLLGDRPPDDPNTDEVPTVNHYVSVLVYRNSLDEDFRNLLYFDSKGNSLSNEAIKHISEIDGVPVTSYLTARLLQQKDSHNCGVLGLINLLKLMVQLQNKIENKDFLYEFKIFFLNKNQQNVLARIRILLGKILNAVPEDVTEICVTKVHDSLRQLHNAINTHCYESVLFQSIAITGIIG